MAPGEIGYVSRRSLGSMDYFFTGEVSVPTQYRFLLARNRLDWRHDSVSHIGPGDQSTCYCAPDPTE